MRDEGGASAPTAHPPRSRPYATMLISGGLAGLVKTLDGTCQRELTNCLLNSFRKALVPVLFYWRSNAVKQHSD